MAYDLISAEDCPERDPRDWVLECCCSSADSSSTGGSANAGGGGASASAGSSGGAAPQRQHSEAQVEWVVLDERRSEVFSTRNQLRSFHVAAHQLPPSRRFRLRITRTANPAAASCMQLACWNLYGALKDAAGGPPDGAAAPSSMQGAAVPQEEQEGSTSAAAAGSWCERALQLLRHGGGADAAQLSAADARLLLRIAHNVHTQPGEARYLGLRAAKVQHLLDSPVALHVLLGVGFRPVLAPAPAGQALGGAAAAGQPLELQMRAEGSAADAEAAGRISELLRGLVEAAGTDAAAAAVAQ